MFMEDCHQDQEEVEPYPFLEQGKLRAGPRIPREKVKRLDFYETIDHITEDSRKTAKRVCHICRKAFSSNKGLGGHMRIHARKAEKRIEPLKAKKIEKSYENGSHGLIKKPVCSICDRDFFSLKSLYGHMRCHPNRDWRGINPPRSPFSRSSAQKIDGAIQENGELDLKKGCLKDWEVKARRGRKGRMAKSRKSHLSSLDKDHEAVDDLMMLVGDRKYRVGHFEAVEKSSHDVEKIVLDRDLKLKRRVKDVKRRKRLNLCDIKPVERVEESTKTLDFDLNEMPSSLSEDEAAV